MEKPTEIADIVLIGAGIMSATLGVLLKELNPNLKIEIYERLNQPAQESSSAWNNAGTGHSAFCELNYTPEGSDGSIHVAKAIKIAESFEQSRQFWSYLVSSKKINNPRDFIHRIPHLSAVFGDENIDFLKKRFESLYPHLLFSEMQFSTDVNQLAQWMPLVMKNRDKDEPVAATYMQDGTDIDFGILTQKMFKYLTSLEGVSLFCNHEVGKLKQNKNGIWRLKSKDVRSNEKCKTKGKFVFIGAGGASLLLLDKADIKEGEGYGGFPVSGQWLQCTNLDIIKKHQAKVYGRASVGSPPMSVPHLDTRIINGKKELLFGPFAGFSTKFLKNGSYLDLVKSIEIDNIKPMLYAGWNNIPLTTYLIEQVLQSNEKRIEALKQYFPDAKAEDWVLLEAGQRVQVIKRDEKEGGILEFGTEIIHSEDGSLACLLGASPGASTAVSIMLEILSSCFSKQMLSEEWQQKIKIMIPSYGQSLNSNPELYTQIKQTIISHLQLK
jgi:malate dehydrogenase (quinone)